MTSESYRYTFDTKVPITEVRYSILLSALAAEGVHGRAQVLLDAEFLVDEGSRTCAVDASTPVGLTISQVFTGLLTRVRREGVLCPASRRALRARLASCGQDFERFGPGARQRWEGGFPRRSAPPCLTPAGP